MTPYPLNMVFNEIIYSFFFQNTKRRIDFSSRVTLKTLRYGISISPDQIDISRLTNHIFFEKVDQMFFW